MRTKQEPIKPIRLKSLRHILNAYLNALNLPVEDFNTRRKVPHDTSSFAKCIAVQLRLKDCGYSTGEIADMLGFKFKTVQKYGERYGYLLNFEQSEKIKLTPFQFNTLMYLQQLRNIPNLAYHNDPEFIDENMVRKNPYWIAGLYYEPPKPT